MQTAAAVVRAATIPTANMAHFSPFVGSSSDGVSEGAEAVSVVVVCSAVISGVGMGVDAIPGAKACPLVAGDGAFTSSSNFSCILSYTRGRRTKQFSMSTDVEHNKHSQEQYALFFVKNIKEEKRSVN